MTTCATAAGPRWGGSSTPPATLKSPATPSWTTLSRSRPRSKAASSKSRRILKNAKVVRHDRPTRQAAIGSTVTVQHEDGAEETYTIVGHLEADPKAGRISNESPIGKAILGKRSGEAAQVAAPAGATKIKVLKVA